MEKNLSIVKNKFIELPNNIEAEQSVIGSILVTNEIFDDISTIISSINFCVSSAYDDVRLRGGGNLFPYSKKLAAKITRGTKK